MALDGIAVSSLVYELKRDLLGARIDKIYQPHSDEIILSVRNNKENYKILVTANSNNPRIHKTLVQKENPMTAPLFCMVMRKHVQGGRILNISQPDFERIIFIDVSTTNELGDISANRIILEIMGKHSNLILTDENNIILDSIKHISHDKSSVREVLPGKKYTLPPSQGKLNPMFLSENEFINRVKNSQGMKTQNFIYQTYMGISPIIASEICYLANIDPSNYITQINDGNKINLYKAFLNIMSKVRSNEFCYEIIQEPEKEKIVDFSVIHMTQFNNFVINQYDSASSMLEHFYTKKDNQYHIKQKSHDLRKLVVTNIERCVKKKDIQNKTMKSIEDKDIWKLKGELLTSNIYEIKKGMIKYTAINFYEESMPKIDISLDREMTPSENAQRYFNKYNKAKRTLQALDIQIKQNDDELRYLEGVLNSIDNSTDAADINEIKSELVNEGYVRRKKLKKGKEEKNKKSKPLHYISSDGLDIYVGKSNTQNDELTMCFADSTDTWMHAKDIPGSHVIIKSNKTIPENTLVEAAMLAAYNSKAKLSSNVPVDYTLRKNVKKPGSSKPGMVIYDHHRTLYVTPDEISINRLHPV